MLNCRVSKLLSNSKGKEQTKHSTTVMRISGCGGLPVMRTSNRLLLSHSSVAEFCVLSSCRVPCIAKLRLLSTVHLQCTCRMSLGGRSLPTRNLPAPASKLAEAPDVLGFGHSGGVWRCLCVTARGVVATPTLVPRPLHPQPTATPSLTRPPWRPPV